MSKKKGHSCYRKGNSVHKQLRPRPRVQTVCEGSPGKADSTIKKWQASLWLLQKPHCLPSLPREPRDWLVWQSSTHSPRGFFLLKKTDLEPHTSTKLPQQPCPRYLPMVATADQDESYGRLRGAWISKLAGHAGLT